MGKINHLQKLEISTKLIFSSSSFILRDAELFLGFDVCNPPASKASMEVENFDWKKNPHPPVYCIKILSVCLSVTNFDPNYLRTGRIERAEKKLGHLCYR